MFGGRHEGHEEPQRNTKTVGMGEPQIPKNTEITEKTERHRGGQRASARRTLKGRFRSLEAWFLHEDTKERKGLGTSPFGPVGLTTVPIPCASDVFLESPKSQTGDAGAPLRGD